MATPRVENGGSQEFQLETRHLVLLIALVIVLCVASFMLGRWVERQNAGTLVSSGGQGGSDPNIVEMGDVAKDLTFFDTLEGNQPAPLKPATQAEVASPRPARTAPSSAQPSSADTRSSRRSVSDAVMIQVFASKDRAAADAIRRRLRTKGYTALMVTDHGTYKVRVGPYADRDEAQRAAAVLHEQENLTTWIP